MKTKIAVATDFVDYYHVLGLKAEWDTEKLRKELLKAFAETKSRVNAASGEKLQQINQRLDWIIRAKKILTDPDAKAKYDIELEQWKKTLNNKERDAATAIPTLQELWRLIDEGRYPTVIKLGKQLVELTPDDDKAWEVYGYANYLWHEYPTAIYAAKEAIRCNPEKAELYADASQYLAAADRWSDAVFQLQKAIKLAPKEIGYKLTLANIYMQHGVLDDAEAVLKGVLTQDSANETASFFMAIVISSRAESRFPEINELLEAGKKPKAQKIVNEVKQAFEEALKLVNKNSEVRELISINSIKVRRVLGVNFYHRVVGFFLDLLLLSPGIWLIANERGTNETANIFGVIIMLLIAIYSWIWLAYKNQGQDLTKRLLGMQVVSDDERLPGLGKLIARAIFKPFSLAIAFVVFIPVVVISFLLELESKKNDFYRVILLFYLFTVGILWRCLKTIVDLSYGTSKELISWPWVFSLFLHEKITGTTVVDSTRDDFMNWSKYRWF